VTRRQDARRRALLWSVVGSVVLSQQALCLADIAGFTSGGTGPTQYTLNGNADATTAGVPNITGGVLNVTTAANNQAASAYYNTQQTLNNWTASFTYTRAGGSATPADGVAFVVQNDARGATALGGGGGAMGYTGVQKSVAIPLDIYGGGGTNPTRTGIGFDGIGFALETSAPVDIRTNPIRVNIAYNNGVITQTLTDTITNATLTRNYTANVPARVGSSGFIGFSGATGGANGGQSVSNFVFTNGAAPTPAALPTPTFLQVGPAGGAGFFGVREVTRNGGFANINDAEAALTTDRDAAVEARVINYTAPSLDIYDSDLRGDFPNDRPFASAPGPDGPGVGNLNDVAIIANGRIRIPTTGYYTFSARSDDGFRLAIAGHRFEFAAGQGGTVVTNTGALQFPNGRGAGTASLGQIYLPAGDHDIQYFGWEGGGGASVELSAAAGLHTGVNNNFNLIGAPARAEVRETRTRFAGTLPTNGFTVIREGWDPADIVTPNSEKALFMLDLAHQHRLDPSSMTPQAMATAQVVNYNDLNQSGGPRTGGTISAPVEPPGNNPTGGDDNYMLGAYGTINIPANRTGVYSFDVHADDLSVFRIYDASGNPVPLISTNRTALDLTNGDGINDAHMSTGATQDSIGRYNLTAAGNYTLEVAFQESGGGSHFQLFGAIGDWDAFGDQFQLVGQNFNDSVSALVAQGLPQGLELVAIPEPGTIGLAGIALSGLLLRRRRGSKSA